MDDDAVEEALAAHLRPGQVRLEGEIVGVVVGKHTRGLTEVLSYTVKVESPYVGGQFVEVAPDLIEVLP